MAKHGPLVEAHSRDKKQSLVTFVYKGNRKTKRVGIGGGIPIGTFPKPLTRLPRTHTSYRTEEVPSDSRISYCYYPNYTPAPDRGGADEWAKWLRKNSVKPDPLYDNPYLGMTAFELPGAPKQIWVKKRSRVRSGEITQGEIHSRFQHRKRTFRVYTPALYNQDESECDVVVMFDGGVVDTLIPLPTVLDNLIAAGRIRPTIAMMINHDHESRISDLVCNESFAKSVVLELIPWLRKNHRVSLKPERSVICGQSLGGLMAAFIAMRYPQVFGNVLSQSGSFWYSKECRSMPLPPPFGAPTGWLTSEYVRSERLPIKFYLDVGRFEQAIDTHQVVENRRLRDVLLAKGYDVTYVETSTGHDYLAWRETVADGLIALVGQG